AYFANLRSLEYIGVMVMLVRLDRKFTKYFWTNVSDSRIDVAGVIEYTNLNPCAYLGGDAILYLPQYLPSDHPLYSTPDDQLFERYCSYLALIRPESERSWVRQYWIHRNRYAQPICDVGFSSRMPSIQTPISNLFLTDSFQLHPEDRTIANSTQLGK